MSNKFLVIYATQTGQAKAIAEEFSELAVANGMSPEIHCLSLFEQKFCLKNEKYAVFICSTTGDGEPPETARKFWRKIKKNSDTFLDHLNYSVLGLGDTNYSNFSNFGKSLNKRLKELNAKEFFPSVWADDAVGLEMVAEPWMHGVLEKLGTVFETKDIGADEKVNSVSVVTNNTAFDMNNVRNDILENNKLNDSIQNTPLSCPTLPDSSLSLPPCPSRFIKLSFPPHEDPVSSVDCTRFSFFGSRSNVTLAKIISARKLTSSDSIKTTLKLDIDISNCGWSYEPGDSIGIVCQNNCIEVDNLISRLGYTDFSNKLCQLELQEETTKRNARIPDYLSSKSTIFQMLQFCCDIRSVPKKAFLRSFIEFTENTVEKRCLEVLCSKQGAEYYLKLILEKNLCLMDILHAFPSCKPPIELLFAINLWLSRFPLYKFFSVQQWKQLCACLYSEHLQRLQPRSYSICSSPLLLPNHISIVFNIVEIDDTAGRFSRQGVCTGWLNSISRIIQNDSNESVDPNNLNENLSKLHLEYQPVEIPIFLRMKSSFHLPENLSIPLIMIGPGTGVAPFVAFLQHRTQLISMMKEDSVVGESWLFFGCRHESRDYLFRNELEGFVSNGSLSRLVTCFSRDDPLGNAPRYVQDNLLIHGQAVTMLMKDKHAKVFICGDARGMAVQMNETLKKVLNLHAEMNMEEAELFLAQMRLNKQIVEDVWT